VNIQFLGETKEFLIDESSRTKEFLSSRCARGRGVNEVISVRPNKGTAEQRDGRTKGQSNKGTADRGRCKVKVIKRKVKVIEGRVNEVIKVRSLRSGH